MRLKFAGINIVFVNGRLGFGLGFRTAELIAGDIDVDEDDIYSSEL